MGAATSAMLMPHECLYPSGLRRQRGEKAVKSSDTLGAYFSSLDVSQSILGLSLKSTIEPWGITSMRAAPAAHLHKWL